VRKEKSCESKVLGKVKHKPVPVGYLGGETAKMPGGHAPFQQSALALGQGYADYGTDGKGGLSNGSDKKAKK
jgi:hypothetical protein